MRNYSKFAGIFTIIGGVFALFYLLVGIAYLLMPQMMNAAMMYEEPTMINDQMSVEIVGVVFLIVGCVICLFSLVAGTFSIMGGIFSIKQRNWALALTGAIASAMLFFPIGIIATVLVAVGKPEFAAPQPLADNIEPGRLAPTE